MLLSEKIRHLRALEGNLRGVGRPLTKSELSRLLQEEHGETLSQAYLSQLEAGKRTHMTARSRALLAAFFKVHPGYLVSDPEGFGTELSTGGLEEGRLDGWLEAAAQDLTTADPEVAAALRDLAGHTSTRKIVLLLARLISHPELLPKLLEAVEMDEVGGNSRRPAALAARSTGSRNRKSRKRSVDAS